MTGARNVKGGLIGLAVGLAGGLAMSLYAFVPLVSVPAWLLEYDDLTRRLLRLAHIAAVMLPLINVVLGPWLDRLALPAASRQLASWLLLAGSATVPGALVVEAWWPATRTLHLAALPVLAFCVGVFVVGIGAWRAEPTALASPTGESSPTAAGASPGSRLRPARATPDRVDGSPDGRPLALTPARPRRDTGADSRARCRTSRGRGPAVRGAQPEKEAEP